MSASLRSKGEGRIQLRSQYDPTYIRVGDSSDRTTNHRDDTEDTSQSSLIETTALLKINALYSYPQLILRVCIITTKDIYINGNLTQQKKSE